MAALASAFVKLRPDTSGFKGEAEQGMKAAGLGRLGEDHGKQLGQGINRGVSSISFGGVIKQAAGLIAILGPVGVAGAALKMGIQTAASLEQAQIGFATLLGSGAKAQDFLKKLSAFAASTPFELPGLIETSRMLIGAGVSADQAIPKLQAWGDAAGAVGISQDAFKRTMIQVTQAISAGVIRTGDLNIIAENGIPVWKLLAEATGKTVPELRKMAEQGQLLSKDVLPLLERQMSKDYGGAMAKQSQTLAGVWSTLKDTVSIGLANALQPLVPILTDLLPKGADLMSRGLAGASEAFAGFINGLRGSQTEAGGFAGTMNNLGGVIRDTVQTVSGIVGWFREHKAVTEALAFAVGGIVAGLIIYNATVLIAAGLTRAMEIATIAWRTTVFLVTAVTQGWTAAQLALNGALIANPIGVIVVVIAALVAGLIYAYTHSQRFREIVDGALRAVAAAGKWMWEVVLQPAFTALVSLWNNVLVPAALFLWHNVLEPAFRGIAAVVSWAWSNVIQPAFNAWVFAVQNFVVPVVLFLWRNIIEPAFKGISFAVQVAWAIISVIFNIWVAIIKNVVGPIVLWLWRNIIEPAFQGIWQRIQFAWSIIHPIFQALGNFIRDVVAPAFRAGVDAIQRAWDRIREAAATPVRFVIDTVINKGIIGTFNTVAKFFGAKGVSTVPVPFAAGGRLPGPASAVDNMLAMGPAGPVGLATGEYIVNARDTRRALPLLEWVNSGMPGFADGGLLGFLSGPVDWFKGKIGAVGDVVRRFGSNPFVEMVAGVGRKLADAAIEKAKSFFGFGGGALGAGGGNIGWQAMWNIIHAAFPTASLFSGYRPGDRAESGSLSYHALGRAIDVTPSVAIGRWIAAHFGAQTKELIHTPMGAEQIWNGKRHVFTGAALQAAHYNHVHWAMDRGGWLMPGWNPPIYNGTGRPEPVTPAPTMDAVVARLDRLIGAVERVAPGVGREINGVGSGIVRAARAH